MRTFEVTCMDGDQFTVDADRADVKDDFMSFTVHETGTRLLIRAELVRMVEALKPLKP